MQPQRARLVSLQLRNWLVDVANDLGLVGVMPIELQLKAERPNPLPVELQLKAEGPDWLPLELQLKAEGPDWLSIELQLKAAGPDGPPG